MSSIGLSGISGISENTLQTRYQKALKQINKLIQINRQLKQSADGHEAQVEKLISEIERLEKDNRQLDEENNILESKYMELESHYQELEAYCKELTDKFQMHQLDQGNFGEKMRQTEAKYQEELQNQAVKYNQLARQAQLINQIYQQNLNTLEINSEKTKELQNQNNELALKNTQLSQENAELSSIIKEKNVDHLKIQLDQAHQTIEKLMRECNELKSKQIDFEVMDERKKVEKYIGITAFQDPRQNEAVRQLIQEYKKKIRNLQYDKKDIEHKYKKLKSHSCQIVPEETYLRKIQGLERLTEKQHREIARIIETYDNQLLNLSRENVKLKEGFYSLSQQLTKKSLDLDQKEKMLYQLRFTTDQIHYQNESLKKANNNLIEVNAEKLKDIQPYKRDISHAESFTIFDKKYSQEMLAKGDKSMNMKKKLNDGTTGTLSPEQTVLSPNNETKQSPNGAQNVHFAHGHGYMNPKNDQDNFKFIQSVNIINGYNVSLGQHKAKH